MNFLDPYDVTSGSSTPPAQPDQSLNEEVTQVIGQLGRFWGGFKRQSQTALEVARKDFTDVVSQAQKELNKFTGDTANDPQTREPSTSGSQPEPEGSQPRASSETLKPATSSSSADDASTSTATINTLFSRLQSALPPNVVSTVQANLPESLKHMPEGTDFTQLRTTLSTEFQRLQGVTRAQAEEYVHKSEVLLRDAMKEAGEVLKDAVKVLPPEEAGPSGSGLIWDGSDMWMLPSDSADVPNNGDKGKGIASAQSAVATRAEALLRRLRSDPEILRHDPEADGGIKEVYVQWLSSEVDSKEGGVENVCWTTKIDEIMKGDDGQALQSTLDAIVPSDLSKDVFWKRYFFRVHQIQTEEEKRKALLQGTIENEEDFSWEDDEAEEGPSSAAPKSATPMKTPTASNPQLSDSTADGAAASSPQAGTPANTSPRESSEESYDVVSGNVSASGEGKDDRKASAESDGDSDWE